MERFDSFWEGPEEIEKGYASFRQFYRSNYLRHMPAARNARVLVISCGPGYFVNMLALEGYTNVEGIDADPAKAAHGSKRSLNCHGADAHEHLEGTRHPYDVIVCEQELNHLTKVEMVAFLELCHRTLSPEGRIIVHGLNGSNPLTGPDAAAQNFDHYNTFTEYSLRQVLEHTGFDRVTVFPLNLYVFHRNPMNYVGWAASSLLHAFFRGVFILYGKSNKIWTKKIGAVGHRAPAGAPRGH
jgi:SAM-dependent methyltransferase